MNKTGFGRMIDGKEAALYTICNSKGLQAEVTDYGATLVRLWVPDRDGNKKDVVLGYDNVEAYQRADCYFGTTVGRNANRIANAKFVIDGVEYQLEVNDNANNLHSGKNSTALRLWEVKECTDSRVTFTTFDAHLNQGFPGNATIDVTYEMTEENGLLIHYHATADQKTTFNFTNHTYFNLNGHDSGDVLSHTLKLQASHYTPVADKCAIPTGEIAPVAGTPFDFIEPKEIGRDIEADDLQLVYGCGYDHNFALDRSGDGVEYAGTVYSSGTGIRMDVWTDCVGIQLYTANHIAGQIGKGGVKHVRRGGVCLETQYFPNAINEVNFKTPITEVGEAYDSTTEYRFMTE